MCRRGRRESSSTRLRIRREYWNRRGAFWTLIMASLFVSFILAFARYPIADLMTYEQGLGAFLTKTIFSMVLLFVRAGINTLPVLIPLLWVIPAMAERFIQALYDVSAQEASEIFDRHVFGMRGLALKPLMIIQEGRIAAGAGSSYDLMGGPGFLIVYNDSAAVLERGGRLTRVVGPYLGLLEPFERVWEVVDLRPRRWPFTVRAMTREGIPIACQVDIAFKIDDRVLDKDGKVRVLSSGPVPAAEGGYEQMPADAQIEEMLKRGGMEKPYPYDPDAVVRAATCTWVRVRQPDHPEQLRRWPGQVVIRYAEGFLREILYEYWLDDLMQPSETAVKHPREIVQERLEQRLRDALPVGNPIGARVLSVHLGEINVDISEEDVGEKLSTQWIEAWRAVEKQRAIKNLAIGEADLARLQAEQVRAQAEMALALTEALRPLVAVGDESQESYKIATRFVETLWWLSYSPQTQAFLPPTAIKTLEELKELVEKGKIEKEEGEQEEEAPD